MTALHHFPETAKQQILSYLSADNFKAAKELYDLYQRQLSIQHHGFVASQSEDGAARQEGR